LNGCLLIMEGRILQRIREKQAHTLNQLSLSLLEYPLFNNQIHILGSLIIFIINYSYIIKKTKTARTFTVVPLICSSSHGFTVETLQKS
jgi:hypothetical protein